VTDIEYPAMNSFPEGAIALVQGGSRGIGLGFCRQLLASGRFARVYVTGRHAVESPDVQALQAEYGEALVPLDMDATQEAAIEAVAARVKEAEGRLHLLVNVSGVLHDKAQGLHPEKKLEDVTPEAVHHAFAINSVAPLLMAKHCHRLLAHKEKAVFASLSARVGSIEDNGFGGWYAYRGSKAAQNMFTRTIAIEFGRRAKNVTVLALHPGTTDTALSEPFQARVPEGKLFTVDFAVGHLLALIDGASTEDSGRFFAWDGEALPW